MKLTTKQIKQIIKEELRSILTEQRLGPWLASQGVTDEEMTRKSIWPGWFRLMKMFQEFNFQKIDGYGESVWQRSGVEPEPEIRTTVTVYYKGMHADMVQEGPNFPYDKHLDMKGQSIVFRPQEWSTPPMSALDAAATRVPKFLTPPESGNDNPMFRSLIEEEEEEEVPDVFKASHRAHKIAEMIMAGISQFETAKNYIRMNIVPMEEIVLAVKERVTPIYHELTKLGDKRSDLFSELAGAERANDYTWSDKISWDIDDVTKQWRQTNIPLNNIYDFWKTADVDADNDFIDEVDKLLHDEELRKMIPGFRHAWKGNYDYDEDDYGIF